jgi:hypothetical protein
MNALLLLLLAQDPHTQPASQPASRPAQLMPGGTGADVTGNLTWIFEVDEKVLHVQESWTLSNESGKLVEKDHLRFPLPEGTRRVNLDEDVRGFKAAENSSEIFATEALGSGTKMITGAHMIDFSGDSVVVRRKIPVRLTGARLIVENIDGLEVRSNVEFDKRVRDLNGLTFQVVNFAPIQAGSIFEIELEGLPSRTTWPRRIAVLLTLAIVGWAAWILMRPKSSDASGKLGPLSAHARRDRIVKAIEILERDFSEEKINEKRYERRHEELITELAAVMREIDLVKTRGAAE